jgi:fermentation-respiration switch protein FrsA (DUF1100 family)
MAAPLRKRWITWLVAAAAALLVGYVGLIAYLAIYQTDLIFRPRRALAMIPSTLGLSPQPVALRGANGFATVGWRMRAAGDSPYWVVFLHGNDATRASDGNVTRYHQLRSLGVNVLAPEYPGYADVTGAPSQTGLLAAARAAYDALRRVDGVDGRRIAIYGWSLGTGGAVPLARDVDEAALIVEGAFSSVLRRAQAAYPYLPITWMVNHPFLSEDLIDAAGSPILFLHSPEDAIIPYEDGQRLFERARSPKQFVSLTGGHITPNLDDEDKYLTSIHTFLSKQAGWTLTPPRRSLAVAVRAAYATGDVTAALDTFARCRAEGDAVWNLAEYELAHVVRRLIVDERFEAAIALARANVRAFPGSATAQVMLARAYEAADDPARAREAYSRSLALDNSPGNPSHGALASLP